MKYVIMLLFSMLLYSCSNDDSHNGNSPSFVLNVEKSQLEPVPGAYMYIRGVAQADNFLKSVRIKIEKWELDKTIEMKTSDVQTYNVDYKFMAPGDAETDENAEINVMVTDNAGLQTQYLFFASATGDSSTPKIYANKNIRLELKDEYDLEEEFEGRTFPLSFDVTDDKLLSEVKVECKELQYEKSISVDAPDFHFEDKFEMPDANVYNFRITASDHNGNVATKELAVLGIKDYDVMYLANVETDAELQSDLYGVPIEVVKDKRFCFHVLYYTLKENTEVRFLKSETTFAASTFGYNSENAFLTEADIDDVSPIILPKANQYYKISLDLEKQKIEYVEVTPPADPNRQTKVGLLKGASGWLDNPGWNPLHAIELTKCSSNTFLMWTELEVNSTHKRLDFTFTGVGDNVWNPQFRFRSAIEPDIVVPGKNGVFCQFPYSIPQNTKYRFYLDTYTNRSWAVLVTGQE